MSENMRGHVFDSDNLEQVRHAARLVPNCPNKMCKKFSKCASFENISYTLFTHFRPDFRSLKSFFALRHFHIARSIQEFERMMK